MNYSDIENHFNKNNLSAAFIPNFKALDILLSYVVCL